MNSVLDEALATNARVLAGRAARRSKGRAETTEGEDEYLHIARSSEASPANKASMASSVPSGYQASSSGKATINERSNRLSLCAKSKRRFRALESETRSGMVVTRI